MNNITAITLLNIATFPMCLFQEPLNSEDDVSDEEGQELFDTENVVVCQYDKVKYTTECKKSNFSYYFKSQILSDEISLCDCLV